MVVAEFFKVSIVFVSYPGQLYNESSISEESEEYGYDYGDGYGEYDDAGCTGAVFSHQSCNVDNFPQDPLKTMTKFKNVQERHFCCNYHGYVAVDDCKVTNVHTLVLRL